MRVFSLASLLGLLACSPTPPTPTDASSDVPAPCLPNGATLTLGTGTAPDIATFRALADGDPVYLTPGPQGGQHIWTGLRGMGFNPAQPRIQLVARNNSDGTILGQFIVSFGLAPTGAPDEYAMLPQPLALDNDQYCAVLPGDVRISVKLDDRRGHCIERSVIAHVAGIDPMADPRDRESRTTCCAQRLLRCFPDGGVRAADASADAIADATLPGDAVTDAASDVSLTDASIPPGD